MDDLEFEISEIVDDDSLPISEKVRRILAIFEREREEDYRSHVIDSETCA
jgi:hypothetical protein